MTSKRTLAASVLVMIAQPGLAAPVRDSHWASLADRLFPVLIKVGSAIRSDQGDIAVSTMLAERRQRILRCVRVAPCIVGTAIWSGPERDLLAKAADRQSSGRRVDADASGDVRRAIDGLNTILNVYGVGKPSRYPLIDGSDQPSGSPQFGARVADAVASSVAGEQDPVTVLDPSIGLALALLDANEGDQSIAFEPLDTKFNGPAEAFARTVDWTKCRYTAIIVPGIGPDDLVTPLSSRGKLNVRMAADRFADGIASFIIVSGGAVHPRGTKRVEAVEMRRALIERFSIPAGRIVIEPYARHTTTNLRNATRRLLALGAPLDRDALIVTNADQSAYIGGAEFKARNQSELGYQPGAIGARLSSTDLVFRPSPHSTQIDPADPLDP